MRRAHPVTGSEASFFHKSRSSSAAAPTQSLERLAIHRNFLPGPTDVVRVQNSKLADMRK